MHCIESVFNLKEITKYKNLVEQCNSDMMKNMLLDRLENYIKNREQ